MKTLSKFWIAWALVLMLAACGKDDKGNDVANVDDIVGTYSGNLTLIGIVPLGTMELAMAKEDDSHVRLAVDLDAEIEKTVGVALSGNFVNEVTRSDKRYTLKPDARNVTVTITALEVPQALTREVKVGGIVEDAKADLDIIMPIPTALLDIMIEAITDETMKTAIKTMIAIIPEDAGNKLVLVNFNGTKR